MSGALIALQVGNNNGSNTFSGALSGGGSLTKIGLGTLTFAGSNSYTGVTNVNAGILALGPAAAALANTVVTVGTGVSGNATLQVGGNCTIGTGIGASMTINGGGNSSGQGGLTFEHRGGRPQHADHQRQPRPWRQCRGQSVALGLQRGRQRRGCDCHQRQPDGQCQGGGLISLNQLGDALAMGVITCSPLPAARISAA